MSRIVLALALASVSSFVAASPTSTTNVNIVGAQATVPVSGTVTVSGAVNVNNSATPVNVAVVNGTSVQAVNKFAFVSVPAGQIDSGQVDVYTNTGSSAVEITSVGANLNQVCPAAAPVWLQIKVYGPDIQAPPILVVPFTVSTNSFLCGAANLPGKLVVGPGDTVAAEINLLANAAPPASITTFVVSISGHTMQ